MGNYSCSWYEWKSPYDGTGLWVLLLLLLLLIRFIEWSDIKDTVSGVSLGSSPGLHSSVPDAETRRRRRLGNLSRPSSDRPSCSDILNMCSEWRRLEKLKNSLEEGKENRVRCAVSLHTIRNRRNAQKHRSARACCCCFSYFLPKHRISDVTWLTVRLNQWEEARGGEWRLREPISIDKGKKKPQTKQKQIKLKK